MTRKSWVAVLTLGVVTVAVGVVWMAYAITQPESTAGGTYVSDSAWPIVAFFVAFIGGTDHPSRWSPVEHPGFVRIAVYVRGGLSRPR